MKFLRQLFAFYITSSTHVALAVCALVGLTILQCDLELDSTLVFFVFFATITGYNFTKYAPIAKLHHRSLTPSLRWIQLFSLGCFVTMCYFALRLPLSVLLCTLPFLILTLGYVIPVFSGAKTLRTLPGFKILIIGMCWTGVTVVLPIVYHDVKWNSELTIIAIQRLLFVVAITIPFEIRDLHYDIPALKTLPQLIGVRHSKALGVGLLFVIALLAVWQNTLLAYETIGTIVFLSIAIVFISKTTIKQSRYYCAFWVESLPILWWGIVMLCHRLF